MSKIKNIIVLGVVVVMIIVVTAITLTVGKDTPEGGGEKDEGGGLFSFFNKEEKEDEEEETMYSLTAEDLSLKYSAEGKLLESEYIVSEEDIVDIEITRDDYAMVMGVYLDSAEGTPFKTANRMYEVISRNKPYQGELLLQEMGKVPGMLLNNKSVLFNLEYTSVNYGNVELNFDRDYPENNISTSNFKYNENGLEYGQTIDSIANCTYDYVKDLGLCDSVKTSIHYKLVGEYPNAILLENTFFMEERYMNTLPVQLIIKLD